MWTEIKIWNLLYSVLRDFHEFVAWFWPLLRGLRPHENTGRDFLQITDDDLIASDLVYAHVRGETSRVEYNPNHRWYYFSEQQTDEVLFIRVHDSANDGRARLSFHTSFENPVTPGAPPRESIEVRTLIFFPPAA